MPLGMEVGLGPGDFVLDRDTTSPPPKTGQSPQLFGPCFCGQTAGWIKMALGTEVGLSPGDFLQDGDQLSSPKRGGAPSPIFGPFLL